MGKRRGVYGMSRAIVSVATPGHIRRYVEKQERLSKELDRLGETAIRLFHTSTPAGCPSHEISSYYFKVYALEQALKDGYETLLWMDSSIFPLRSLGGLWRLVETQGYWFSRNLHPESINCGQVTCDSALPILGLTREEAFQVPHLITTSFGLDFRQEIARVFFAEFRRLADAGAFIGPWVNDQGQASKDSRVYGHRHDQTVASVIAHRIGMKTTTPPQWIADESGETEETVLLTKR